MSEHEEFKSTLNEAPVVEAPVVEAPVIHENALSVDIPAAHEEALNAEPRVQFSETNTFFPESMEIEDVKMNPISSEEVHVDDETTPILDQTNEHVETPATNDVNTLAKVVGLLLLSNVEHEKYQVSISPEVRSILAKMMDHAECFNDIENSLKEIIKDNKIDANDVPQIMLLLTSVYNSVKKFKLSSITTKNCGDVLKFLVEIAVKENLIVVKNDVAILLSCLSNIIDSSIQLMQMKDAMPEIRSIFKCISDVVRGVLGNKAV